METRGASCTSAFPLLEVCLRAALLYNTSQAFVLLTITAQVQIQLKLYKRFLLAPITLTEEAQEGLLTMLLLEISSTT